MCSRHEFFQTATFAAANVPESPGILSMPRKAIPSLEINLDGQKLVNQVNRLVRFFAFFGKVATIYLTIRERRITINQAVQVLRESQDEQVPSSRPSGLAALALHRVS